MKLLMHMCCGPCSLYPVQKLQEEGVDFQGLFYNPNIHPEDEFSRRKENASKVSEIKGFDVTYIDSVMIDKWKNFEGTDSQRCCMCYRQRLEKTAAFANESGFDAFTTTLLVSPYQNHELIKEVGEELAKKYSSTFYYKDFRAGFREGQQQARELGIYRQKFCGCILSQ